MDYVDVNIATPWQLAVLLNISRDEVEALLLARPFADRQAFWAALPSGLAQGEPDLLLSKLNINAATAGDLIRFTGISAAVALRITQARPFFLPRQLGLASGDEAYRQLELVFTTPDIHYTDKLTGHHTRLGADASRVLISRSESEGVTDVVRELGLKPVFPKARGPYEVYSLSDSEAAEGALPKLQESYGRNLLPTFMDENSSFRYLNPKFCVVQFDEGVAAERQQELIAELNLKIEERHRTNGLYTLRVQAAQSDPDALTRALTALNTLAEVRFAEPNYLGFDDAESPTVLRPDNDTQPGLPWNLLMTRVPEAWQAGQGSSDVVIAVIDSGVDETHPALAGSLLSRASSDDWNFVADGDPSPDDEEGHGTFIAGLLGGNGWQGVWGICPGSRILPLKISLSGEVNSYANRRAAILYALSRSPGRAPLIINLSWKTTGDVALIRDAVASVVGKGAIVTASAGNFPIRENEPHFPSGYPGVICVAAVNSSRQRADYSFFGNSVTLAAPGGDSDNTPSAIRSAAPGGGVTTGFGTSYAAPHVAGIAALVASAHPDLDAAGVRSLIENAAVPLTDMGMGYGLCDAVAAVGQPAFRREKDPLVAFNRANVEGLVRQYGLNPFTARLLVARQPIRRLEDVSGALGLTDVQYRAIVASFEGESPGGGSFGGGGASGSW